MDVVFDISKDAANVAKHGVSLRLARLLFEGDVLTVEDDRRDYGEPRSVSFGRVNGDCLSVPGPTGTARAA